MIENAACHCLLERKQLNYFVDVGRNQMKKLSKGLLIAIEGIDGAGKTTQVQRLSEHYKRHGYDVATFKEPTDGQFGQQIRMLAKFGRHTVTPNEEFELFLKDRIEDCDINIRPALEINKLVFMDRYYFSNMAYQGALGVDRNYILNRNEEIAPIPELVIFLDVAARVGLSRIKNFRKEDNNHFEQEDYLNKVRKVFRQMDFPYLQRVEGSRDEDTVFINLRNIVQDVISPFIIPDSYQVDLFGSELQLRNSIQLKN